MALIQIKFVTFLLKNDLLSRILKCYQNKHKHKYEQIMRFIFVLHSINWEEHWSSQTKQWETDF